MCCIGGQHFHDFCGYSLATNMEKMEMVCMAWPYCRDHFLVSKDFFHCERLKMSKVRFFLMFVLYKAGCIFGESLTPKPNMLPLMIWSGIDIIAVLLMIWWIGFVYPEKKDSSSL